MDAISNALGWLFGTRTGVLYLIVGGIVAFLVIAFVLERRTKRRYFNHERSEGDWDLFDDEDESV